MTNFNIDIIQSDSHTLEITTNSANLFNTSSDIDRFFLDITENIDGVITSSVNNIEITTAIGDISDQLIEIYNVSGINLELNTDCIISHPSISASLSVNNSGNFFIQDIYLDRYGHITGIVSSQASGSGTGGGSSTFLGLTDTPNSFSGQAAKFLSVNQAESALEFISGVLISGTNYHTNINAAISSNNSGPVFIQDILLDQYGHTTGISVASVSTASTRTRSHNTISSDYNISSSDDIILIKALSQDIQITMPAASGVNGYTFTFKKISGSYNCIINPQSGEFIDSNSSLNIYHINVAFALFSNGSGWYIL